MLLPSPVRTSSSVYWICSVLGLRRSAYILLYTGMLSSIAFCTCRGRSGITIGLLGLVADGWNVLVVSTPSNHGIHSWKTARSCGVSSQLSIRSSNGIPTFWQNSRNVVSAETVIVANVQIHTYGWSGSGRGQGRSDRGIWVYTLKISPSKLLWGRNGVRTAIEHEYWSFIPPQNILYPQNKFLATPLATGDALPYFIPRMGRVPHYLLKSM